MKRQSQIACLIWAFAIILSGCKKSEVKNSGASLKQDSNKTESAGDKLYDVLGYGYDVTGRFANSESSRLQVLDIVKFVAEDPGSYSPNTHVEEFFDYTIGENASSYTRELAQKYTATTGFLGLFKGEANTAFNSKNSFSSKFAYASVSKIIKQKSMKLYSTISNLRDNYTTAKFRSDVALLSPAELVQRYGTHALTDITLGAKFDINYSTKTYSSNRSESVKAGLVLSGMFKTFGMTADVDVKKEEANSNYNQSLNYNSVGGDGTKGIIGNIALDNSTIKLSIADWQSTCNSENIALVKIGKDGLVALDQLINDPVKSEAVRIYIKNYLEDNKVIVTPEAPEAPIWYPSWSKPFLSFDQSVYTANRKYVLHLQRDGNLVLSNVASGRALWAINKSGGNFLIFQPDGNLLLISSDNRMLWASNVYLKNQDYSNSQDLRFEFQDDGNLVLSVRGSVLGATGTGGGIVSSHFGKLK